MKTENMKPITVAYSEFRNSVVNAVNNSNLPAFVVIDVLNNIIHEMDPVAQRQYEIDLKQYEAQIKKQQESAGSVEPEEAVDQESRGESDE